MKKNNNLVATLSDRYYLSKAKQLFSSIYWNSGWKGDYMLLVYGVADNELTWFKKRGVLIEKCKLITKEKLGTYNSILGCKLYLFREKFKKWDHVVYLDTDIIIRGSLENLTNISGYAAVAENNNKTLYEQFYNCKPVQKELSNKPSFNAGVFAFNTKIIDKDTFAQMKKLLIKYRKNSIYGDQGVQNLYFYNQWQSLPIIYNLFPKYFVNKYDIDPDKIKGLIIHFADLGKNSKPWMPKNPFYREWKNNLKKADTIDNFNTHQYASEKKWMYLRCLANFYFLEIRLFASKYLRFFQ